MYYYIFKPTVLKGQKSRESKHTLILESLWQVVGAQNQPLQ